MAGDTVITIIGNITGDPELRFTPSGAAVANFTVASTPRAFDRQSNEWKDGETLFMRCSVWRDAAENVAESLNRGTRVIVSGRLKSRSYETKEGEKRTVVEMEVDEVGPSLRYASAKVTKTQRGNGGGGFGGQQGGSFGGQQEDPWATGPSGCLRWRPDRSRPGRPGLERRPAVRQPGRPGQPGRRPGWLGQQRPRLRRAPVLIQRNSIDPIPGQLPGLSPEEGEHHDGQARCAQTEEEGEPPQDRQGREHRLQGHRAAAQVHLRPRQDPCPPGDRVSVQEQRLIATAVKNAREMALLPYSSSAR